MTMSDPLKLSKAYASRDDAAMGGFMKVMKNSTAWHTNEFGFWVIMKAVKVGQKAVPNYFYSEPEDGGSSEVSLTLPRGVIVVGHCHTHPQRIQTGNFSTGDKRSFQELAKVRPGIASYLLNPASEIRRAVTEDEFPAGVTVNWDKNVTP
jgi:hypothetical protein